MRWEEPQHRSLCPLQGGGESLQLRSYEKEGLPVCGSRVLLWSLELPFVFFLKSSLQLNLFKQAIKTFPFLFHFGPCQSLSLSEPGLWKIRSFCLFKCSYTSQRTIQQMIGMCSALPSCIREKGPSGVWTALFPCLNGFFLLAFPTSPNC